MATSLKDLLAQRVALEAKIEELQAAEMTEAISKVRALIEEHNLTQKDIFPSKSNTKVRKTTTSKVAAKYRDPISGKEWSGRGVSPKWMSVLVAAGHTKDEYLI